MDAFWIILTGFLVGSACSLLGCLLILRRLAMLGDAISHAVLPGIVVAYLISGSRESIVITLGAGIVGVLISVLIEFLHQRAKLQTDAAIGVTFTWLFAIGVILISAFADNVDLDQDCVLYGEISLVPFETSEILGLSLPYIVPLISGLLLLILIFFRLGTSRLSVISFDPVFAGASGILISVWHYATTALVSFTTVISFEAVGAILVVAFLVVPPCTAWLFAKSFNAMLIIAVSLNLLIAVGGYYAAAAYDVSISGMMVTVAGIIFFGVLLLSLLKNKKFKGRSAPKTT